MTAGNPAALAATRMQPLANRSDNTQAGRWDQNIGSPI